MDTLFVSYSSLWDMIRNEAKDDPYMQRISKLATENPGSPYELQNGLVCLKNRVVVPPKSNVIQQLLKEFHDSPIGGHSGVLRTCKRLSQQFYWPSMHKTVQNYIASCDVCQRAKSQTLSQRVFYNPFPFHVKFGTILPWISSKDFFLLMAKMQSWSLLTG